MGTTTTLMTFEEFEQLPDRPGKTELLNGELIELPPAKKKHNKIGKRIFLALHEAAAKLRRERPDLALGSVDYEMSYRLSRHPDSCLIPDVSLTHPGQPGDDYYEGAPLLAVEVISETKTAEHTNGKVRSYFASGAAEVWVVYPETMSVWVFHGSSAVRVATRLETALLPSFSMELSALFSAED